jgi:O-antigen ligase
VVAAGIGIGGAVVMIAKFVSAWNEGQVNRIALNWRVAVAGVAMLAVAVFGGELFYTPIVLPVVIVVCLTMISLTDEIELHQLIIGLPVVAMCTSAVLNPAIREYSGIQGLIVISAFVVFLFVGKVDSKIISTGLHLAARAFPVACGILYYFGSNRNVLGLYCVIFGAYVISQKRWGLVAVYGAIILFMGGRSAMVAFSVVLMIGYNLPKSWWASVGAAGLFLVSVRPETIGVRFKVWTDAINLFRQHPWFGVGPGGIMAYNQPIAEAELARQQIALARAGQFIGYPIAARNTLHAHNILLQTAAEGGAVGLLALALASAWLLWRWKFMALWQRCIIAGVLVCGIMDYPFFMPGPLILFAIVIGAKNENSANSW